MSTIIAVDLTLLSRGAILVTAFDDPDFDVYKWLGSITNAEDIGVFTWRGMDAYVANSANLSTEAYEKVAYRILSDVYEDGLHNDVVLIQIPLKIDFLAN